MNNLQLAFLMPLLMLGSMVVVRGRYENCAMLMENEVQPLLAEALTAAGDGGSTLLLTNINFTTVCQAQGSIRDTFRSLSLIVTYENAEISATRQLHLQCVSGAWSTDNFGSSAGSASPPTTGTITTPLRTDCFLCANPNQLPMVTDAEHCLVCPTACTGLNRCFGSEINMRICCNYFDMTDSCVTACPADSTPNAESTCLCNAGFTASGSNCTENEECTCANGGTCTSIGGGIVCSCTAGFTGETCEIDVNECLENPCANGGTCTNMAGTFMCNCAPRYLGSTCENEEDGGAGLGVGAIIGITVAVMVVLVVLIAVSTTLFIVFWVRKKN